MSTPLVDLVASNLRRAYVAKGNPSLRALAAQAGVSTSSVRYALNPDLRNPTHKGSAAPNLDVIDKLAQALGYEAWQIMSGDLDPDNPISKTLTKREAVIYEKIQSALKDL